MKQIFSTKNILVFYSLLFIIYVLVPMLNVLLLDQKGNESEKIASELNVYNWEDYFGEHTISDFEKKFSVKVNLDIFEEEDIALSQVQSDPSRYDVVIVSDLMVRQMRDLRLLSKIRKENIPNFANIGSEFINPPYDPENAYSVPYLWGTTGIAVNRKYIRDDEDSWSILWDERYLGKIAMLDDSSEVIASSLKYLGYSLNSTDRKELDEARRILLEQRPLLQGYHDTIDIRERLISEKLWASHEYSGEAVNAASKNENIEYIIPEEGCSLWTDNFIIPRESPNKYTAEMFINFVLDPKVSADIANYLWYANCNSKAGQFTERRVLEDSGLYPEKEDLKRCEYFLEKGDLHSRWNQIWVEINK